MNKYWIWIALGLLLLGLFVNTVTHSPQQNSRSDQKIASETVPAVKQVPRSTAQVRTGTGEHVVVDTEWLIEPGKSVGPITGKTTLAELKHHFGPENVEMGSVPGPEGSTQPGATVFPDDPSRRLSVVWKENGQTPERVQIAEDKSLWHTVEGVTIGTSLKELEKLNGGSFMLSGFDWDYGGTVLSWGDQGKLRPRFQKEGALILQLYPIVQNYPEGAELDISGDRTFSSANPDMQTANPVVTKITVVFR